MKIILDIRLLVNLTTGEEKYIGNIKTQTENLAEFSAVSSASHYTEEALKVIIKELNDNMKNVKEQT